MVALTYDDGPDPVWTERVLDALAASGATATFFVLGPEAEGNPHLVRRALAEGHEVALHADRHVRHTEMDAEQIADDAARALERLGALGVEPTRWRVPWGVATGDTRVVADRLGLELVHWTVDTHDWRGDSAEVMQADCAAGLAADHPVVLMHDGLGPGARRSGCAQTVELTERLLARSGVQGVSLERAAARA